MTTTAAATRRRDGGSVSGSIAIDGSSTVAPFAQAAQEAFQAENPDVKITVGTAGTGGGFEKFCAGETDISNASRPIKDDEEVPVCEKNNVVYDEVQVANDGIAVVTNTALKVDCLTVDELKKMWNKGSKVKNLSEVNPKLPDTELTLFGPGTDSGTFDFFTDQINGEEGVSRDDYQPSEDDNILVQGVEGSEGGLGYFGFSYYEQNQDKLNLVGVDGGDGCVKPSTEAIQDGSYTPLSRPLFMYPSEKAAQAARGQGVHGLRDRQLQRHRHELADRADDGRSGGRGQEGARVGGVERRRLMEAASTAAGARAVPSLGAARRRYGEDLIKGLLILATLLSILTTTGIVIALLVPTIQFFGDVGVWEFLGGEQVDAALRAAELRRSPLVVGHLAHHRA